MKKVFEWFQYNIVPILAVVLLCVLFIGVLVFCVQFTSVNEEKDLPNRFELVESFWVKGNRYFVLKDTGTNVLYLSTGRDVEVIVDYEGNPVTWDPYGG